MVGGTVFGLRFLVCVCVWWLCVVSCTVFGLCVWWVVCVVAVCGMRYAVRFLGCVWWLCVVCGTVFGLCVCSGCVWWVVRWYGFCVCGFWGSSMLCVCWRGVSVRVSSVRCIVCMVHMHGACSLSVLPVLCFLVRFSIRKKKGLYI